MNDLSFKYILKTLIILISLMNILCVDLRDLREKPKFFRRFSQRAL